ncbi:YdjY domain-containing protein [Stieleria varia]|uniref:Uncharacterized protein n=1 Tax=Stieleria varia TaxID=2528005 RepID=A0A5C6B9B1_9BACT|nr:YdjY domain-containing protein [Stieleria varia]TWU08550.1 hypothetical protein Pla52n_11330 [Stieleria varia]
MLGNLFAVLLMCGVAVIPASFSGSCWAQEAAGNTEAETTEAETTASEKPQLPAPGAAQATEAKSETTEETRSPEDVARTAFGDPPDAKQLTKLRGLWIDRKRHRVYIDGYVATNRGALEMFACPAGTKEHESVVATLAKSSEVHGALLAVEANPGTPVRFDPEFLPPTGQVIQIWVCWRDDKKKFHVADARSWVQKEGTEESMDSDFVFAGSSFWQDPSDGKEYYRADAGDMICVSNFSSAMIDVSDNSSANADALLFSAYETRVPERHTPVRLILVPVPVPTDDPVHDEKAKAKLTKPEEEVLPLSRK